MTNEEYFLYAIEHDLISDINWLYTVLTIPDQEDYKNTFVKMQQDGFYVYIDNTLTLLTEYIPDSPIFTIHDIVHIKKNTIANITKDITTTVGIFITNYVILYKPFKDKLSYINGSFPIGKVESTIADLLMDEKITVQQYKTFVDNCQYLEQLSDIVVISSTPTNMVAPPGLNEYKAKLYKQYTNEYGPDWNKDKVSVGKYEAELKTYLKNYLKDDPTYGKMMSGKVLNNSWAKKFLTIGGATSFDPNKVVQVDTPLMDGFPKDKDKLAAMFNSSRYASYSRGAGTVLGGATAKVIGRAVNPIGITKDDCKVTYGELMAVNDHNYASLKGRYIIKNKKSSLIPDIDTAKTYIGKTIELRSTKYCKVKDGDFCKLCAGKYLSLKPESIIESTLQIAATILNLELKRMHKTSIEVVYTDITDVIF